jgi:hypothetical protein
MNKYIKYFTIPLGIEVENNAHANILFIDNIKIYIVKSNVCKYDFNISNIFNILNNFI